MAISRDDLKKMCLNALPVKNEQLISGARKTALYRMNRSALEEELAFLKACQAEVPSAQTAAEIDFIEMMIAPIRQPKISALLGRLVSPDTQLMADTQELIRDLRAIGE